MRRGAAVAIVFLGVLAFFAPFGYAVLPPVVNQVSNFVDAVPHYVRDLQDNPTIQDLDQRFGVIDRLNQYVTPASSAPRSPATSSAIEPAGRRLRAQGPDRS